MGRIRTVKPELLTHEELFMMEQETGLPMRISFVGLFTVCDREGRFKWQPNRIKLAVLPYDVVDFSRVLDALLTRDMVRQYAVDGELYGFIPTFPKHQVINNREAASDLPEPNEFNTLDASSTRAPRVNHASPTPLVHAQGEGKGKEGKGREKEGNGIAESDDASKPKKTKASSADDSVFFSDVDPQVAKDFRAIRKAKRLPLTQTAMDEINIEVRKAGISLEDGLRICCARGWGGFRADWLQREQQGRQIGAAPRAPSRHSGFDQLDYNEGIEDGRIT